MHVQYQFPTDKRNINNYNNGFFCIQDFKIFCVLKKINVNYY